MGRRAHSVCKRLVSCIPPPRCICTARRSRSRAARGPQRRLPAASRAAGQLGTVHCAREARRSSLIESRQSQSRPTSCCLRCQLSPLQSAVATGAVSCWPQRLPQSAASGLPVACPWLTLAPVMLSVRVGGPSGRVAAVTCSWSRQAAGALAGVISPASTAGSWTLRQRRSHSRIASGSCCLHPVGRRCEPPPGNKAHSAVQLLILDIAAISREFRDSPHLELCISSSASWYLDTV